MRHDGRRADELRALDIELDYLEQPHGAVLYAQGKTIVLCTALKLGARNFARPAWQVGTQAVSALVMLFFAARLIWLWR